MTRSKLENPRRLELVLGLVLASTMMIGADCRHRNTEPPDTSDTSEPPDTSDTSEPPDTSDTSEPPDEIELEAEIPAAVHTDMQIIIDDVYGGGELVSHTVEEGDVEVVWQLEYELDRAHEAGDAARLEHALTSQGYTIEERTPTESLGLFVGKSSIDAEILVSASVGSESLGVSITKM